MPARSLTWPILTALLAIALAGCGLTDPYQQHTTTIRPAAPTGTATTTSADQGDPAPERGGTIPAPTRAAQHKVAAGAAQQTPRGALERYAAIYLNWNAGNVTRVQRELAAISLDQARAQALQAAASAAHDPQLTHSHLANRGHVIAVAPGQNSAAGHWVIVTSEQTTGQGDYRGLPPTLHVIYAQLTDAGRGWVVSEWAPQN